MFRATFRPPLPSRRLCCWPRRRGAETYQVHGKQKVIDEEAGLYKMTGDLVGRWATTSFEEVATAPYFEGKGTEKFSGCIDRRRDRSCKGDPSGTLTFDFRYWALYGVGRSGVARLGLLLAPDHGRDGRLRGRDRRADLRRLADREPGQDGLHRHPHHQGRQGVSTRGQDGRGTARLLRRAVRGSGPYAPRPAARLQSRVRSEKLARRTRSPWTTGSPARTSPATASRRCSAAAAWARSTARIDERLGRAVALKLLAPHRADDPAFRDRLLRESRLAASLDHPNVMPVYDAGEVDGRLFLAMRYVDGTDLRRCCGGRARSSPPARSRSRRRSPTRSTRRTSTVSSTAT